MKTLVHVITLFLLSFSLFSCRNEEDSILKTTSQSSFFDLKVGSVWKYKTYNKNSNNNLGFVFTGYETTEKILGKETVNGMEFYKKSTQTVNTIYNSTNPEVISYLRVNNKGHLVQVQNLTDANNVLENSGRVLHPGFDTNYNHMESITEGDILFKLYPDANLTMEGQTYTVKPYNGVFTPGANYQYLQSQTIENLYQKNTGKIKSVCYSVNGTICIEERLISYVPGN